MGKIGFSYCPSQEYNKKPILLEWSCGYLEYMIPDIKCSWLHHREDGPAVITDKGHKSWWWYGNMALGENQWKSTIWRKKIEIKKFLL